MIVAAAPDGIRIQQPEWRRPGDGGLIDVNIRLEHAQVGDELKHRIEIALRSAAVALADAIKLELIDAVIRHHIQASRAESLVIPWPGQGEIIFADFKALRLAEPDSFLVRLAVAAPR